MITGSAITGVERSICAQVTTTSGIAEISSVRICGPSIQRSTSQIGECLAQRKAHVALDDRMLHGRRRHQPWLATDELPALGLAGVPGLELGNRPWPVLSMRCFRHGPPNP
jgi:hypothetical protein